MSRYVAALGGEKALRALEQRMVEARLRFSTPPLDEEGKPCQPPEASENDSEDPPTCRVREQLGQFVLYTTAPGHLYRRMVAGTTIDERGYDGQVGWQLQVEPPVLMLEDEAESLSSREDALLHWYLDYDKRGISPELLTPRQVEVDGTQIWLDGVVWKDTEGKLVPRQLWFRRADGLLVEEIERGARDDGELTRVIRYDQFQTVDGVQVAHRTRQSTQGAGMEQQVELQVQAVRHGPIEPERFAIPTLPAPEPAPDERLIALQTAADIAKAEPRDVGVMIDLARKAFAAARFDMAAQAARDTLRLDANEPEALWILARVESYRGNARKALELLSRARKHGLGAGPAAIASAFIEIERGAWGKAGHLFERAGQEALAERYAAFEGKPYVTRGACEADLELLPGQLPVVKARIADDDRDVALLVDTGAADLILRKSVAQRLVVLTDATAPLVPGGPSVPHGQVGEVRFGDLSLRNVPVVVFPDATLAEMADAVPLDGVIGLRALRELQLTVDPGARRLRLVRDDRKCRAQLAVGREGFELPIWLHQSQYIYLFAAMNGSEGLFLLNTGMRGAALAANEGAYLRAGIGAPPLRRDRVPMVQVASLRFGVVRGHLETQQVGAAYGYMPQTETADQFRMDGMLGMAALGGRPWTLELGSRKLYVRPAAPRSESPAAAQPEPKK